VRAHNLVERRAAAGNGRVGEYLLDSPPAVHSQIKIIENRNQVPPPRDVIEIILKKTRTLLKDGLPPTHPPGNLGVGPANASYFIPSGSVSLVVTSPPFLDIVRYDSDNWLRCWFAGRACGDIAATPAVPGGVALGRSSWR
jgi:hypothetical protein